MFIIKSWHTRVAGWNIKFGWQELLPIKAFRFESTPFISATTMISAAAEEVLTCTFGIQQYITYKISIKSSMYILILHIFIYINVYTPHIVQYKQKWEYISMVTTKPTTTSTQNSDWQSTVKQTTIHFPVWLGFTPLLRWFLPNSINGWL